jgi:hypothetical protein
MFNLAAIFKKGGRLILIFYCFFSPKTYLPQTPYHAYFIHLGNSNQKIAKIG